jgi:hypothetical protein
MAERCNCRGVLCSHASERCNSYATNLVRVRQGPGCEEKRVLCDACLAVEKKHFPKQIEILRTWQKEIRP